MRVKFFGGPLDGAEMNMGEHPPHEWRVPKRPRITLACTDSGVVPVTEVSMNLDIYRLVRDPWRGPAYCFVSRPR